jgi:hypothetical protein
LAVFPPLLEENPTLDPAHSHAQTIHWRPTLFPESKSSFKRGSMSLDRSSLLLLLPTVAQPLEASFSPISLFFA